MKKSINFKKTCIALAVAQAWCMGHAQAATIRVTTGTENLINGCTFRNAVAAINSGAAGNNCTNQFGADVFGTNDAIEFFKVTSITLEDGQITIDDDDGDSSTSVNVSINPGGTRVIFRRVSSNAFRIFEIKNSTVSFDNVEITGGITDDFGGGGVYGSDSTIFLENSSVSGNSADSGGGIKVRNNSSVTLGNSSVSGNLSEFDGGGIDSYNSVITLNDSTVSGNSADGRGGGIFTFGNPNNDFNGTATLNNSTVSGNSAARDAPTNPSAASGGGIYNHGVLTLDNSTVSGNYSNSRGGGVFNNSAGSVTLNNSTVTRNSVATSGGGVDSFGVTTLINSIVAGNISLGNANLDELGNTNAMTASNSLFGSSTSGFNPASSPADNNIVVNLNNISLNSVLLPLADNGGPTLTHALPIGSPVIGAGKNCLSLDQRGEPRDVQCDIGAYEYQEDASFYVVPLPNGKSVIFSL